MATFSKTNGCEATCIVVFRTMVPTRLSGACWIFQVIGDQKGWPHGFRVEGHLQILQNSSGTPWKAPKIGGFVGRFVDPLKMSICLRFSFQGILMDSTAICHVLPSSKAKTAVLPPSWFGCAARPVGPWKMPWNICGPSPRWPVAIPT